MSASVAAFFKIEICKGLAVAVTKGQHINEEEE